MPLRSLCLVLLCTVLPALGCAARRPLPPGGLSIVVLQQDWHEIGLGYEAAPALSRLRSGSLVDPLFKAEPGDIDTYRWSSETLLLTPPATSRLLDALTHSARQQEGIQKLNALKESLGDGNALAHALYTRGFVVLLGEERIYGGIFLDESSQMAIGFPVARAELEDGRAVVHFLPLHLPFFGTDPAADPKAGNDPPGDVPASMLEHFRAEAMSPKAVENRKLLQGPRIRAWLVAAGKLK